MCGSPHKGGRWGCGLTGEMPSCTARSRVAGGAGQLGARARDGSRVGCRAPGRGLIAQGEPLQAFKGGVWEV